VKTYEDQHGSNKSTYWVIFELIWRDFFRYIAGCTARACPSYHIYCAICLSSSPACTNASHPDHAMYSLRAYAALMPWFPSLQPRVHR
jgi:hypothetical protein